MQNDYLGGKFHCLVATYLVFAFIPVFLIAGTRSDSQEDHAADKALDDGPGSLYTGMPLENAVLESGQKYFERLLKTYGPSDFMDFWQTDRRVKVYLNNEYLAIEAQQEQPVLYCNVQSPEGAVRIKFRLRTTVMSDCIVRWLTTVSPRRSDDKMTRVKLNSDGQWHEYEVALPIRGALTNIAIELTQTTGIWEVAELQVLVNERHPLVVTQATSVGEAIEYTVTNKGDRPIAFQHLDQTHTLEMSESIRLAVSPEIRDCFHVFDLTLVPQDYPKIEFSAFRYQPELKCRWYILPLGEFLLCVTESGSLARVQHTSSTEPFMILAPLVYGWAKTLQFTAETRMPLLEQSELDDAAKVAEARRLAVAEGNMLLFHSGESHTVVQTVGNEIRVSIESDQPFEGPVVRAIGYMQGALLSGCEYLGPNDVSSSTIDVNALYANRFEPPLTWLTLPLAAMAVTNVGQLGEHEIPINCVIAMAWDDPEIQPTFDMVNHLDVVDDMRLSLRSDSKVSAVIYVAEGSLVDGIEWFLKRWTLPKIPERLRTQEEQDALTLRAFREALAGNDGASWGFCAEPDWERRPYDAIASIIWRLSGRIPSVPDQYVEGGSAIPNETIHFLTGRPLDLAERKRERVDVIIREMRPDGSFLVPTRFPDVETTAPSVGYCARRTLELMDFARLTGDRRIFQFAEKGISFLERFRIPRGGYFGETPLHTPDLLSAAHLVILHVWAYEFSANGKYLDRARYWALMGIPFVYLREEKPHMPYATVPMYGASDRESPVWFGTSQPWCGCVYAYGLALLAKHDRSIDWRTISRGILHHAESLQFTDGPYAGCIPDGFSLETQEPISWKVNPAVLASLRSQLDFSYNSHVVVRERNIHVTSPFPVELTRDGIFVEGAPEGLDYQLLINGTQVLDIQSHKGRDFVPLK